MSSEDKSSEIVSSDIENPELTTPSEKQTVGDRRRPGRIERPSSALLSLLRYSKGVSDTHAKSDGLRPFKGIVYGILFMVPIWALIVAGVLWMIR
jgi:hypothetical protein